MVFNLRSAALHYLCTIHILGGNYMKKLTHNYAAALMLIGVVAGIGLTAGTTASAMSKSQKTRLASYAKLDQKTTKTSQKIDREFDKVGIRNLTKLTRHNMSSRVVQPFEPDVFTIGNKLTVGNQNRTHGVTLGKHSVVVGNINTWGVANVKTTTLSKKNQKKVFRTIGSKWQSAVSMTKLSQAAQTAFLTKHTSKTAFAYGAYSNLPDLYQKNAQSYFDQDKNNNGFVTVTADNYLNYYHNYATKAGTPNYTKISQSIKIKKFTRGKSVYTYYLAKPLKGFGTKKVNIAGKKMYQLKMSLGHVFQAYDNTNGDAGTFRITVNVGSKQFYANLGNIAEAYAYSLQGSQDGQSAFDEQKAKTYIQGLQ
ncbi:hypothetical protein FD38_GL001719 [Levilactobacillus zymae DSM 19395]|nr:hypothetical protein FD38_GL001719 [Levilactobacillus zymae DSM 19395]